MIRVKSVSKEGVYYLVNGWNKYKSFWEKNGNSSIVLFPNIGIAKRSLSILLKNMPDYADDEFIFEEVEQKRRFDKVKVTAMVHSKEKREEVDLLEKRGDNDYVVRTNDGVKCTAIFNPFVGIYYADDIYGVIKEDK